MNNIHVIPLNDDIMHHASPKCLCQPLNDPESTTVYVHHAFDNREAQERQGNPVKGKGWTNIGEIT